jgi:hypothetical protein
MDFSDAMRAVKNGESIYRKSWLDTGAKVCLQNGRLMIFMSDTKWHQWIVSEEDIMADDWAIIVRRLATAEEIEAGEEIEASADIAAVEAPANFPCLVDDEVKSVGGLLDSDGEVYREED